MATSGSVGLKIESWNWFHWKDQKILQKISYSNDWFDQNSSRHLEKTIFLATR